MRTLCSALLVSLALALPAAAQETRGTILGTVRDASGVVPGATVTITSLDTRGTQKLVTSDSGYFEAPLLQPGTYSVTVEMPGFKTLTQTDLVLAVGQQLGLTLRLEIGAIAESVTVAAATPLLDTSSVSSGQNFDSRMVEGLPMFSNMPIMLTRFAAGVNPPTNQSLVSQGFADGTTPDLRQHEPRAQLPAGRTAHIAGPHGRPECAELRRLQQPGHRSTNSDFGKVTTAVASAGAMRFFNFVMRFTF